MLNKGNILFPVVKRKCWGSTFFNLWLTLGDLSVRFIKSLSGKSFQGLKNEFSNMKQSHKRLNGMIKFVLWGKASSLSTENLRLNAYQMNVRSSHLLKFCLFVFPWTTSRYCTLQTLHNYLLHQTEFLAYTFLQLQTVTSPSVKIYSVILMEMFKNMLHCA